MKVVADLIRKSVAGSLMEGASSPSSNASKLHIQISDTNSTMKGKETSKVRRGLDQVSNQFNWDWVKNWRTVLLKASFWRMVSTSEAQKTFTWPAGSLKSSMFDRLIKAKALTKNLTYSIM